MSATNETTGPGSEGRASRSAEAGGAGGSPPHASGREMAVWTLVVFAVALAARAIVLWDLSSVRLFEIKMGDGRVYHQWAQRLAAGDWIGDSVFYQAPLYPYFVGVVYSIAGESLLMLRMIQAVLGATACALLAQAGWRFFSSKTVGVMAGLALALYPPVLFGDLSLQKSVLDVFFVCVILALLGDVDPSRRPRATAVVGLGVVLGALILTRENALVFVPVLALWLWLLPPAGLRPRALRLGLFAAALALLLLPVAIRNYAISGDFHLTTSQFGHNFFIGNNAHADGTYQALVFARGEPLVERDDAVAIAARALGRTPTPAEVSDFYTGLALEYIRSQPLDWIALLGRKVLLVFNAIELVDTEDHYTFARYAWLLRAPGVVLHFGVLAPLAFLGVYLHLRERRRLWPLYALVASYLATLLLFYIFGRYRLPLVPILLLFAAAGVASLGELFRVRSPRERAIALGGTALVALVANWPLLDEHAMESVTRYNLGNELAKLGLEEDAVLEFERAIELDERNALAHHNLGVMRAREKKYGTAQRHFERAIEVVPQYAEAYFNLGRAKLDSYDRPGAIASFQKGLAIDGEQPDLWVELGRMQLAEGDREGAARSFARALELDAGHEGAQQGVSALRGS